MPKRVYRFYDNVYVYNIPALLEPFIGQWSLLLCFGDYMCDCNQLMANGNRNCGQA